MARTKESTREQKPEVLTPGKRSKPKTFVRDGTKEQFVAAYCGFTDIGVFRTFCLSVFALPFYLQLQQYKKQQPQWIGVLNLLESPTYEQDFASDDDATAVYDSTASDTTEAENKLQANMGTALLACQMLRRLRLARTFLSEDKFDQYNALQASAQSNYDTYAQVTGNTMPSKLVPTFPAKNLPDFEPKFDGETDLEPLNRCLTVLSYIKYFTSDNVWSKRLTERWNKANAINPSFIPGWMRPSLNRQTTPEPADRNSNAESKDIKKVKVVWLRDNELATNRAFKKKFGENLNRNTRCHELNFVAFHHGGSNRRRRGD